MNLRSQTAEFPGRSFYRYQGVNWPRFIPWLFLPCGAALLLAVGMFGLVSVGEYYVIILPVIAAAMVGGLMVLAVSKGHCRNPFVAGIIGCIAGFALYLNYFYVGMIGQIGPKTAARPDLLPRYIRFRMESDVSRDSNIHQDDENTHHLKSDTVTNWLTFSIEFAACLAIPCFFAVQRARKPYCNVCQKWMVREGTQFQPDQSNAILDALRVSSARQLAAICATPIFATIPNTTLALEICPTLKEGMSRDCPVYASLKSITKVGRSAGSDAFDGLNGKTLLRSLQLNPDELAALGSRFKILESITGRAAIASLKPEEPAAEEKTPVGAFVDVKPVEPDYAGKVMTRRNSLIGLAYVFGGLAVIIAGGVIAAFGGVTAFPDKNSPQNVPPATKAMGIAALAIGGTIFAGGCIFFLVNPSFFSNRFLMRRAREEFGRRPKCLVDPNDPDALFVEIVPKLNWGKLMLEMASDVGYFKVDQGRREILFEGDKERFRLPADAITYCGIEFFVEGQGSHAATKIYYVVIRANRPNEFWEVPIRERLGAGKFRSRRRRKSAERILRLIQELRPANQGTLTHV